MCTENIYIAGRYNKYLRNLSQSPWIDKDDVRIKHSVQELIEEGLNKYLQFDKCVFSSSGREDVDVRMLGKGRPFVFKMVNPWNPNSYNKQTMRHIEDFINLKHASKVRVRNLQVVTKESVSKNLKDGEESKTKEYRALCCCSKKLTREDMERISNITDLYIDQKTPIRVLHRRSLAVRRRKVHRMRIDEVNLDEFESITAADLDSVFALTLLTEAGTYIKEFVHGDFGRTEPNLSSILGDCDTDLMELDVMEVYLDWPPSIDREEDKEKQDIKQADLVSGDPANDKMDRSELSLAELFAQGLKTVREAEKMPRGDARQGLFVKSRYLFEKAKELVGSLNLFSDNETIDDVATNDLKFLLIPAYLAKIFISAECGSNRLETFTRAETMIKEFLHSIMKYGLADESVDKVMKSDVTSEIATTGCTGSDLDSAMRARNEKIEKYKKMKLVESRLDELERQVNRGPNVDDEILREYYMILLRKWIEDSLDSLIREVRPAIFFERNRSGQTESVATQPSVSNPSPKTITIVKNQLQKQVFGIGYPSRPTVTVDEFISKKINDGDLAFHAQKEIYANSLQRYAEKPDLLREQEELSDAEHDEKEEREDADELKKKRQWDEFKDENPRGSGNRHNMG